MHLGDYIYEGAPQPGGVRQHDGPEVDGLDSYRNRHALYRTAALDPAATMTGPEQERWLLRGLDRLDAR